MKEKTNPIWGGHSASSPAEVLQHINASVGFDKKLYRQDIAGSLAHVRMLVAQGIVEERKGTRIIDGLNRILEEMEEDRFPLEEALEDIHMNIEMGLTEKIGPDAGWMHTARSRNDQVATDFKLWVREAIDLLDGELQAFQAALIERAEEHTATIMPGFTHLQTAQPVTLGHHLLAYVEMIGRDRGRLADTRARLNLCPLGSAALAGTSFPIDREMTAKELGFDGPTVNSIDAVSDRDFALEFLGNLSILAVHLSRLAEEIVVWMSAPFHFITLSEAFTTGSSIMPQKRNPDAAELVRGKTGRVCGSLQTLLMVMKGLPLAYSKDMQEDKEPVFDAVEQMLPCVRVMTGMVQDFTADEAALRAAAEGGYSTATELADWLVQTLNIPFRKAHHITGAIVREAEERGVSLAELPLEVMQKVEKAITEEVYTALDVEKAVVRRVSVGGTAPANVKKQLQAARKRYMKG